MSSLIKHALVEFKAAGWLDVDGNYCDDMQKLMCEQVMELLVLFNSHGHSGHSAPYAINLLKKLAMYDPISPLTGDDDEWQEIDADLSQNKRDSSVFKGNGVAYWVDGIVFREPGGVCYTNIDSRVYIEFPWVKPESKYIDVERTESGDVIYPDDFDLFDLAGC